MIGKLATMFTWFGFDPYKFYRSMKGVVPYFRDRRELKKQMRLGSNEFPIASTHMCLDDRYLGNGMAQGHYFHQDLLVARRVFQNNPAEHVDVGSSVGSFVAHVAVFRPIKVFDIRPQTNRVRNIEFVQADMMRPVREELHGCCDSLSCLHALEHFGLGRYGDPVDINGHLRGLENLFNVLKPGGKFYLSVPIGKQRIEFNAHRVFNVGTLLEWFNGKYNVDCFSYVDDQGQLHENAGLQPSRVAENFGCVYGCGIFELTKLAS